jgi:hypothetical protein
LHVDFWLDFASVYPEIEEIVVDVTTRELHSTMKMMIHRVLFQILLCVSVDLVPDCGTFFHQSELDAGEV